VQAIVRDIAQREAIGMMFCVEEESGAGIHKRDHTFHEQVLATTAKLANST
jgi:hypothetical protein